METLTRVETATKGGDDQFGETEQEDNLYSCHDIHLGY